MSKYAPLADYFRAATGNELKLTFSQVEQIIGAKLPPSALKHEAWWQNSTPGTDSHVQALAWMTTGWRKWRVDLAARHVVFNRVGSHPDEEALDSLVPRRKEVIYDILLRAKISVQRWHQRKDGTKVDNFRSNPQYCYNWSFGSPEEGYVLCLWHGSLKATEGVPYFAESVRDTKNQLVRIAEDMANTASARARASEQADRASNLDTAIMESYSRRLPVRVIVCEGDRRTRDELAEKASAVSRRFLDSEPWYVHQYDRATGMCKIARGVEPDIDAAPTNRPAEENGETEDVIQKRAIKTRRGQNDFRNRLLVAYRRRCAVTGSFVDGILEAAHIVPHAEKTDYQTRNGLLLRADIHTLFDLNLLTVDTRYRVKVSKLLKNSEYKNYHGLRLNTVPELSADQPSVDALEQRLREFETEELKR